MVELSCGVSASRGIIFGRPYCAGLVPGRGYFKRFHFEEERLAQGWSREYLRDQVSLFLDLCWIQRTKPLQRNVECRGRQPLMIFESK
jgi:hypothetical protein